MRICLQSLRIILHKGTGNKNDGKMYSTRHGMFRTLLCCAQLMSLGSDKAKDVCKICATVCDACAAECSKHENEHCKECAEACKLCAAECKKMAA
jgi:hypothetical protein